MPDIPSVGINPFDIFDPNDVNIEAQAYPRPLSPAQALAQQLAALLNISTFGHPRVLDPPQAIVTPAAVQVQQQVFTLPSLSLGVADPANPEVNIAAQVIQVTPAAEFLVTQEGNFRTDSTADKIRFRIFQVDTLSVGSATHYRLTIGTALVNPATAASVAAVNLYTLGIDLNYLEVTFPNSAPGLDPQDIPTAPIIFYGINQIVVDGTDLTGDAPVANDVIDVPTQRVGPSDIVGLVGLAPANVFIAPSPPVATTEVAASNPTVNVDIDSANPGNPIITSGQRIPLLLFQNLPIPGAFAVEYATPLSLGLPVNVFV